MQHKLHKVFSHLHKLERIVAKWFRFQIKLYRPPLRKLLRTDRLWNYFAVIIVDTLSLVILLLRCRQNVVFRTERNQHSRHSLLEETIMINGESCNYYRGIARERNERYKMLLARQVLPRATNTSCKRVIALLAIQVNTKPQ